MSNFLSAEGPESKGEGLTNFTWQIAPREIPFEPGCLCYLCSIELGAPLQCSANAPAALIGTKWPDVRTWLVVFWEMEIAWAAELKTETSAPWSLEQVRRHFAALRDTWQQVKINKGTAT